MRLPRVPSAVAISVLLLAAFPATLAASGMSATILSPSDGETVRNGTEVRLHLEGYADEAWQISGYLTLDGAWAGSFSDSTTDNGTGGTTLSARLRVDTTGLEAGEHALSAIVFTNADGPVSAAPVTVVLAVDHPTSITDLSASYRKGGRVNVSLHAEDADGMDRLFIDANGLGGYYLRRVNATSWDGAVEFPVTPRLGTFTVTVTIVDMHGAVAYANTSLVVAGERVVVFERAITTQAGEHVDVTTHALPRVGDAVLEICVSRCDAGNGTGEPVNDTGGNATRVGLGQPGVGQFQPCGTNEPYAAQNLPAWAVWYVGQTAERGEIFRPAHPPAPLASWPIPRVSPGTGGAGVCGEGQARDTDAPEGAIYARVGGSPLGQQTCGAMRGTTSCALGTIGFPTTLELDWAQGPMKTARVRVIGVEL